MIVEVWMRHCPFCGSDDLDADYWASQTEEGGPIETGPGCMDCGATAPSLAIWNDRSPLGERCVAIERRVSDDETAA